MELRSAVWPARSAALAAPSAANASGYLVKCCMELRSAVWPARSAAQTAASAANASGYLVKRCMELRSAVWPARSAAQTAASALRLESGVPTYYHFCMETVTILPDL